MPSKPWCRSNPLSATSTVSQLFSRTTEREVRSAQVSVFQNLLFLNEPTFFVIMCYLTLFTSSCFLKFYILYYMQKYLVKKRLSVVVFFGRLRSSPGSFRVRSMKKTRTRLSWPWASSVPLTPSSRSWRTTKRCLSPTHTHAYEHSKNYRK